LIDHTGINVSDLATSRVFYERVLATLGYVVRLDIGVGVGFGATDETLGADPGGDFWISQGTPFTPRSHIAFRAAGPEQVRAFHEAARKAM
jgi:catechol 2,3-dioxygenase-like lactoylglutathione lyase family enzyme